MNNRTRPQKKPIDNDEWTNKIQKFADDAGIHPTVLCQHVGYSDAAWSRWVLNKSRIRPFTAQAILAIPVPPEVAVARKWVEKMQRKGRKG